MGTITTRREKVEWLESRIDKVFAKDNTDFIKVDVLLAKFAYENGCSERTGMQILVMLKRVGKFRIKENEIYK